MQTSLTHRYVFMVRERPSILLVAGRVRRTAGVGYLEDINSENFVSLNREPRNVYGILVGWNTENRIRGYY